ncbi:MAG: DEAD/DEAH box helicase [Pseudomonadota bacterium]
MLIDISNRISIADCPEDMADLIKQKLTIPNPRYQEALKQGRWTGHLKQQLQFYSVSDNRLHIPRGFLYPLLDLASDHELEITVQDHRVRHPDLPFQFSGTLLAPQIPAVKQVLQFSQGILKAATGAGKTVMALEIVHKRAQPTLIIVPNRTLLHQWVKNIETFLDLKSGDIGILGDGTTRVSPTITVGIINTVVRVIREIHHLFGHVIIDEAHRAVSSLYQDTLSHVDATFILGLSATPYRRDGLTKLLEFSLGDVVADIDKEDLVLAGQIVRAETQWIRTVFEGSIDASADYSGAIRELTLDIDRNRLICSTIAGDSRQGPSLILSDRKEHCYALQSMLFREYAIRSEVLVGGLDTHVQQEILDRVAKGLCRYLIGTSQLLGEGFNLPGLEVLYLTVPFRFRGKLIQNIGRILRASGNKKTARIYDFVDTRVGVFKSSALARVKTYASIGVINLKADKVQ